jgi:methylated-DNA-[protein]-cysteine S-methyltransferase
MNTRHAIIDTIIGGITLVASDEAIVGLYYPHHWTNPSRDHFGPRVDAHSDALLGSATNQLTEYLSGHRTSFELRKAATGNAFQRRVWALLDEIPIGHTTTYGQLAERLGDKRLARMVGQAVGHNPLSIIVPCHRVVGSDGKLTGYAGGLEIKQFLLQLEQQMPAITGLTILQGWALGRLSAQYGSPGRDVWALPQK